MKARLSSSDSARNPESTHEERSPLKNGNRQGDYSNAPRCGAQTRAGTACKRAAMRNAKGIHTRCPLHGGKCTGPRTAEGRERIGKSNLKHGRYSKAEIEKKQCFKAMREFWEHMDDLDERLLAHAILVFCGEEIDRCLKSGADNELAKYCQGVLDVMKYMQEPLEKVAPLIGMKPWKPDRMERRWRSALEAGAAGLGCAAYREALAKC